MSPNAFSWKKDTKATSGQTKRISILLRSSLEHGREAAKSLAETVRQLMNTMAATGMAVDSSGSESPSTFPLLSDRPANDEEEKHDYGADDENEDEDEVDNSFEYNPVNDFSIASASSEDFSGDVVQEQSVKEALLGTDADVTMEPLTSTKDDAGVEKVDVERHTVIQDTTVVKKYSHVDEGDAVEQDSDNVQQPNKLMAITVSTSSAVIDQQTSSTFGSAATGEGTSSYISSDDGQDCSNEDVDMGLEFQDKNVASPVGRSEETKEIDEALAQSSPDAEDEADEAKKKKQTPADGNEEQTEDAEENVEMSEVVSETPPSADAEPEAAKRKRQTPAISRFALRKRQSPPPKDSASESSARVEKKTTQSSLSTPTTTPPTTSKKPIKKKQNVTPASVPVPATPQGSSTSPKPSRKRTPTTPARVSKEKRAVSKKRKQSHLAVDSGEFEDHSQPLRRSSRIKNEPPKFTYPVKQLSDETVMSHFERKAENDKTSPATTTTTCKYCGKVTTASRGAAKKHLETCPAFSSHEHFASQTVEESTIEDKPEFPISTTSSEVMKVVQLMGTEALATKLKGAFNHAPFAGDAPISRFQELIKDEVTGLRNLNVLKLLDAVNPLDGPVIQLHVKLPGIRRTTGQDIVHSVSMAKARALEKCTLRFPAPRSVAEQFIVPLEKELGLEYAMRQHTASLVNCPKDGSVLDWRFLRTETVVFQLSGNAMWKMKMGQVEHPLQDLQPQSWLLDATAQAAKVHRVAAMNKGAVGFLTPGENLDIFDENKSGDVMENEQQEHILKPGSVAYVPAGTWFEVETEGTNALWLEVHLASMTYEDLALSALKQLAWGDKQWRMKVQLYPGNRGQLKSRRRHMEACIKSLRNEMTELEGGDLLPEYLGTEDLRDLVAQGLIRDVSTFPDSTSIEVDLSNPKFKLKHEKVFKDAAYRVNPIAVLMNTDEIPHLSLEDDEEQESGNGRGSRTTHRALKKNPKPQPKRKQTLRVLSQTGEHTYILDELFGNAELQSKLHVKFQCSAEQSRLVEWLRYRGSEPFGVEEFSRGDDSLRHSKSPARCEESARNLLRFLCFVGYVTQVKAP